MIFILIPTDLTTKSTLADNYHSDLLLQFQILQPKENDVVVICHHRNASNGLTNHSTGYHGWLFLVFRGLFLQGL